MRNAIILSMIAVTSACGSADMKKDNSEIVHNQIGRFAIVPASGDYPPIVIDTAAGCIMALQRSEEGEIKIDEVSFLEGTNSCNASKQLLVADTLSRVVKQ